MSEHPWTPGPWQIARDDRKWIVGIQPLSPDDGRHEKGVTYWAAYADDAGLDVSEADAALIALAPEMAEAILAWSDVERRGMRTKDNAYEDAMRLMYDAARKLRQIGANDE